MSQLPPDPFDAMLRRMREKAQLAVANANIQAVADEKAAAAAKKLKDEEAARVAGLKNLADVLGNVGRTATVSFASATVSLGGLVRAASTSTWSTFTNSMQMLAGTIGSELVPFVSRLSFAIQDVSNWIEGLDPALRANIASWALWIVGGLGVVSVVTKIGFAIKDVIVLGGGLYKAFLFVSTSPFGLWIVGLTLLGAAIGGAIGYFAGLNAEADKAASRQAMQKGLFKQIEAGGVGKVTQETFAKALDPTNEHDRRVMQRLEQARSPEARQAIISEELANAKAMAARNPLERATKTASAVRRALAEDVEANVSVGGGIAMEGLSRQELRTKNIAKALESLGTPADRARTSAETVVSNFGGGVQGIGAKDISDDVIKKITGSFESLAEKASNKVNIFGAAMEQGFDPITGKAAPGKRPLISAPREMSASIGDVAGARNQFQLALSAMGGFDMQKMARERTNYLKELAEAADFTNKKLEEIAAKRPRVDD